jgi:tetratricopeptide (TPR) repeat protein
LPSVHSVRDQFARDGHFDEASLQSLRALRAHQPEDEAVTALFKTALLEREDWNNLVALLYDPAEQDRGLDRSLELASVLVRAQRLPEAAAVLAQQAQVTPDHPRLIWLSAYTAFHRGRHDEAAGFLDGQLEVLVAAGIDDALLLRGTVALHRGDPELGEQLFERFVTARPDHPAAHNALGQALSKRGDDVRAQEHFDRARDLHADASRGEAGQARLSAQASALNDAFARRDFAVCEQLLAAMIPVADPALQADLYRLEAQVHQSQGHSDLADEALRKAARLEVEPR